MALDPKERIQGRRTSLERIMRDDDDTTGADIREWHMSMEGKTIFLRRRADSSDFIMLSTDDVEYFTDDLDTLISH